MIRQSFIYLSAGWLAQTNVLYKHGFTICNGRNAHLIDRMASQFLVIFSYFNFESLRKTWQYEVIRLMSEHFGTQFKPLKNLAYRKNTDGFYVYAKDRDPDEEGQKGRDHSEDVHGCVSYMMRYASRPARESPFTKPVSIFSRRWSFISRMKTSGPYATMVFTIPDQRTIWKKSMH